MSKKVIDLSKFNLVEDWKKVKAAVDAVILRLGYRGAHTGTITYDPKYLEYMAACQKHGIPTMIYFFPCSITVAEAEAEANFIIAAAKKVKLAGPIWLDSEVVYQDRSGRSDRLGKADRTKYLNVILRRLHEAGYECGVYASKSWFARNLNDNDLEPYCLRWVAQWADQLTYTGHDVALWQYTNSGSIPGINGRVDISHSYIAIDGAHGTQDVSSGVTRQDIVDQICSWEGYSEANGKHKLIVDIYNYYLPTAVKTGTLNYKVTYSDAWCATAASAAYIAAGAPEIFPIECGCPRTIILAQRMGIWKEADGYIPKPADAVLYDWEDSGSGDNTGTPDHIGDYETIFATVPHSGCKFYIPEAPDSTYFASLNTVANAFITWIGTQTGCAIHYPEENETVQINDVNITFNNADPSYWYDNYDANSLNYNWLSITAYVRFGGTAMQITGDLYTKAEKYFFDTLKAGRSADIYQAPHHGLSHYYVNRNGIMQVNPKVILTNYGIDNEYVTSRKYSSAIVDLAALFGIPVFDTNDNGTFEITITNGDIAYQQLTPFVTAATLDNYAYIRGLVLGGAPIEYSVSDHGIKDVLKMMPANSAFTINAGNSYKIITDFGLSTEAIIKVAKFVGGSTNYLWDRTDTSRFYFNIDIYTREFGRNHFNFHGIYRDSDGFTVYDNSATKPVILGFVAKKQNGDDAYLSLTKTNSLSRGNGISISDNAIVVARTGVYEMSLTAYNVNVSMDLSFASATYYIRNGGTVTRVAQLTAGTSYRITLESNNTSTISGHIKVLAYVDSVAFPT